MFDLFFLTFTQWCSR